MLIARIHVRDGRHDERRLNDVCKAIQDKLIKALKNPEDDFFQIIHEVLRNRFLHTSSFLIRDVAVALPRRASTSRTA